jgi:hypothetical protein
LPQKKEPAAEKVRRRGFIPGQKNFGEKFLAEKLFTKKFIAIILQR